MKFNYVLLENQEVMYGNLMKIIKDEAEPLKLSEGSKVIPLKPLVSHHHKENPAHHDLLSANTLVSCAMCLL